MDDRVVAAQFRPQRELKKVSRHTARVGEHIDSELLQARHEYPSNEAVSTGHKYSHERNTSLIGRKSKREKISRSFASLPAVPQ